MKSPASEQAKLVYTIKQLAERMQICEVSARRMTNIEGFPLIKVGRKKLIPVKPFEEWLAQRALESK